MRRYTSKLFATFFGLSWLAWPRAWAQAPEPPPVAAPEAPAERPAADDPTPASPSEPPPPAPMAMPVVEPAKEATDPTLAPPPAPTAPTATSSPPSPIILARPDPESTVEGIRRFSFNHPDADVRVLPVAEFGALFILKHRYQGGSDGTDFNLQRDGGQASAFLSWRISAELELFRHHRVVLLYQPIDLRTRATLTDDFRANGLTFPAGTPMQFRYGFDFYRLSYLYDFLPEADDELAIGLSLQLRVANLEFSSLDGSLQRTSQNLGPVPLLKVRGRYTFDNDVFIGTEIDGIGIRFPSDQGSVLGLFFDTSIRAGYSPTNFAEAYVNLRYLGGGARGPGSEPLSSEFGDGFNDNFIHALNLSLGFAVK